MIKKHDKVMTILLSIILLILVIGISITNNEVKGYYLIMFIGIIIFFLSIVVKNERLEKLVIIFFVISIPFFTDLTIGQQIEDFHVVTKGYYRLNFIHLFAIYFLGKILINLKKIKHGIDLVLLIVFNIICIVSMTQSINFNASIFDYLRYIVMTIIYIYFSRIFDFKKYYDAFIRYVIYGATIQLVLGLLQKVKGGGIGLSFLGEGYNVFRIGVIGYERGMSGTMSHPGPYSLYAIFVLAWILFDNRRKNNILRISGIIICTLMVILAAGRTSMVLLFVIYAIYVFNNIIKLDINNIIAVSVLTILLIIGAVIFNEQLEPIVNRFIGSDILQQASNRREHVEIAKYYIDQSPLIGHGLNNYLDLTIRDYPMQFYSNFYFRNPIHNLYLLQCVEIGIIGAVIYGVFLIVALIKVNIIRKSKDSITSIAIGYGAAILVYCIYNLQGYAGVQTKILLLCILSIAFISNIYSLYSNKGVE